MIQAILFDFTNTLVELHEPDSVIEAADQAIFSGLQQHGLGWPEPEFRRIWRPIFLRSLQSGPPTHGSSPYVASVLELAATAGLELTPAVAGAIVEAGLLPWRTHTSLPAEVAPALTLLHASYRLALISNFNHPPYIAAMLNHFELAACFATVIVSGAVGLRKPDPAIFALALEQLGVAAAASVMIGDNPAEDLAGAQAAGCHTILLDRQQRQPAYSGLRATNLLEVIELIAQIEREAQC